MVRPKLAVGAHVAPEHPLEEAAAVGADCLQVFLSNPQGWRKPPPRDDAEELRRSSLPLYVHAPYLINVCSPRSNVTSWPRAARKLASSVPSRPVEKFVSRRTISIVS